MKYESLKAIADLAPGNILVPLTTAEVNEYSGLGPNQQWAQYLRRNKLIRTDAALGDGKKIRKMTITPMGEAFLRTAEKYGEEAAISDNRKIMARNKTVPKPPKSTDRSAALEEAKRILGPDATIPELVEAAKFLTGDQS